MLQRFVPFECNAPAYSFAYIQLGRGRAFQDDWPCHDFYGSEHFMIPTYKASGRVGFLSLPLLILALVAAVLLAFVYQLALGWIPLIYVNFLATIGVGMALGYAGAWVVKQGKVRNALVAISIGILLAATGLGAKYFFQYRSLLAEATNLVMRENTIPEHQRADVRKTLVDGGFTFLYHLEFRATQGWALGRRGGNGLPIKGVFVYLVWAIEAGIICYIAVREAKRAAGEPFSEQLNTWASESDIVMTLPINDASMVSKIQSASGVNDLLEIPIPKTDVSNQFAVYKVNSIPGQEFEDAYLSVSLLTVTTNKNGEPQKTETPLVKHAILSAENRKHLIENASLLREAIAEYRKSLQAEAAASESEVPSPAPDAPPDDDKIS